MANLYEVHLEVQAARRLRPQTESLSLPVVDAAGDAWEVAFAFNTAGDAIVATVVTSARVEEDADAEDGAEADAEAGV